jgi:hypothetical protein
MEYYKDVWPIDPCSARAPHQWPGWPDRKQFALVLTHDVEWEKGQSRCRIVASMEQETDLHQRFILF